jgi:uncharacterized protein YcbX
MATEPSPPTLPTLRIARLLLYPVKGLGGMELREHPVEARGLAGDRRFMLVDATGTFISQRTHPAMAPVRTGFVAGGGSPTRLRLTHPDRPPLEVEAVPGSHDAEGRPRARLPVTVWGDALEAVAPSAEADAWFSELLETPVRLVWQPDDAHRPTDPAYAPGGEVSLADGYPLLVVTEGSLEALNARLETPLPMDRFRPNVVVAGAEPYAEDRWRRVRLGPLAMAGVKRCARCSVTTVDQATGVRGQEPLRTLATYRRGGGAGGEGSAGAGVGGGEGAAASAASSDGAAAASSATTDGKVYFGQNLVPLEVGVLRVGDPVLVEEEGAVGP